MKLLITLDEISDLGNWILFCEEEGYDLYSCRWGRGSMEITLTLEQCIRYGIQLPGYTLEEK